VRWRPRWPSYTKRISLLLGSIVDQEVPASHTALSVINLARALTAGGQTQPRNYNSHFTRGFNLIWGIWGTYVPIQTVPRMFSATNPKPVPSWYCNLELLDYTTVQLVFVDLSSMYIIISVCKFVGYMSVCKLQQTNYRGGASIVKQVGGR
jgi:hypothetical protein